MTVPVAVRGVWRRRDLSLDGGDPFEYQDAYWIQGVSRFVDIRRDHQGGNGMAFAGTTTASGGKLHWTHEVDLDWVVAAGDDEAGYELDGDLLTETGSVDLGDGPQPYTETWERLEPWTGPGIVAQAGERDAAGWLVAVGSYAAVLVDAGETRGGWLVQWTSHEWSFVASSTTGTIPFALDLAAAGTIPGPASVRWSLHREATG